MIECDYCRIKKRYYFEYATKKIPAQRPVEFREDAQVLCNNLLAIKNDSFVLNLRFFGETTLLTIIPNITFVT